MPALRKTYTEIMSNKYAEHMQNLCNKYAEIMQQICNIYANTMQHIYRNYATPNMPKLCRNYATKYAEIMAEIFQKICINYALVNMRIICSCNMRILYSCNMIKNIAQGSCIFNSLPYCLQWCLPRFLCLKNFAPTNNG